MFTYKHTVQYYETDQMAVVHHSNYIRWFEETRCAWLESVGYGYARMEKDGAVSPVLSVNAEYRSMTRFGESVIITPKITMFNGVRFEVGYTVCDESTGAVRCQGRTSHCFIDRDGNVIRIKKSHPELYETFMRLYEEGKNESTAE